MVFGRVGSLGNGCAATQEDVRIQYDAIWVVRTCRRRLLVAEVNFVDGQGLKCNRHARQRLAGGVPNIATDVSLTRDPTATSERWRGTRACSMSFTRDIVYPRAAIFSMGVSGNACVLDWSGELVDFVLVRWWPCMVIVICLML